jgi:hypothetical protein
LAVVRALRAFVFAGALAGVRRVLARVPVLLRAAGLRGVEVVVLVVAAISVSAPLAMTLGRCSLSVR